MTNSTSTTRSSSSKPTLQLLNLHLRPPLSFESSTLLDNAAAYLWKTTTVRRDEVKSYVEQALKIHPDIPLILLGDFNEKSSVGVFTSNSTFSNYLRENDYVDALQDATTWYWPLKGPFSLWGSYDHVFYRKQEWKVEAQQVLDKYKERASDHLPCIVSLRRAHKAKQEDSKEGEANFSRMTESDVEALLQYVDAKKKVRMKVTPAIKTFADEHNFNPNQARSRFYERMRLIKLLKEQSESTSSSTTSSTTATTTHNSKEMNVLPDVVSRLIKEEQQKQEQKKRKQQQVDDENDDVENDENEDEYDFDKLLVSTPGKVTTVEKNIEHLLSAIRFENETTRIIIYRLCSHMDYAISKGTPRNRIVSLTFTVASQPNINKMVKKLSNIKCRK
ncbi:hypothetical protein FDP41_010727 [Naegleria fowleri]|uniref:Endonuclease/exonuclease/phosphatase domain-containing protein n=1 Tax=Naegleria fowleri TaxID=5763 RepID=A0A6A5CAT2_NAEFO|nr:uncharacterized protein FDP41_010727 [Naegleria fowleri]KAF0982748.1 hypothetical protein FDP41_010727 [Naegleria fowleri]